MASQIEIELKEVNKNLRSLNKEISQLSRKLDVIENNTRDEIKKMVWYKRRNDSVDVYVQASIVSVGDIDTVAQHFTCEFFLSMRWEEPNLREMVENQDAIDWSDQWEPGIYFVDLVQIEKYERNETLSSPKTEGGDPEVTFYYHIRGTFKEVLDITHFPFDYQPLTLTITTSWTWNFVNLQKDYEKDDNIRTWNFTGKNEWKLEPHVLTESTFTPKEPAASDNIFPIYRIKMHALRKYGYFIYNVALIMDFLAALSFTAYTVEASNAGERIQISLTLLLTSIALKYVVNGFVPQVPYPTLLDKFILCCISFQFLVAVENAVAALINIKYPQFLQMFEWVSFGALVFIYFLMNVVFGGFWVKYISSSKRLRRKHEKQYRKEKERAKILREHCSMGKKLSVAQSFFTTIELDAEEDLGLTPRKQSKTKNRWRMMKKKKEKKVKSGAIKYRI